MSDGMFQGSCVGYELKYYLWEKNAVLDFRNYEFKLCAGNPVDFVFLNYSHPA